MNAFGKFIFIATTLLTTSAFASDWTAVECRLSTGAKGSKPSVVSESATILRSTMTTPSAKETAGQFKIQDVEVTVDVSTYLPGNPLLTVSAYLPESDGIMLSGSSDGSAVDIQLMQPSEGHLRSMSCRLK